MTFPELQKEITEERFQIPKRLLALDPGETTGFAFFVNAELHTMGQLKTKPLDEAIDIMADKIEELNPDVIVYEQYRVYGWKADMHAWDKLHTTQFIGAIETLCRLRKLPAFNQTAQIAKAFCTDKKLKEWGYYARGEKHARDAVRHGCYFLLFNLEKHNKLTCDK